jgi:hypothetical protein
VPTTHSYILVPLLAAAVGYNLPATALTPPPLPHEKPEGWGEWVDVFKAIIASPHGQQQQLKKRMLDQLGGREANHQPNYIHSTLQEFVFDMMEQTHLRQQQALAAYVHDVNKHILDRQQAAQAAAPPPQQQAPQTPAPPPQQQAPQAPAPAPQQQQAAPAAPRPVPRHREQPDVDGMAPVYYTEARFGQLHARGRGTIQGDAVQAFFSTLMEQQGWQLLMGTGFRYKVASITLDQITQAMVDSDHFGTNSLRRLVEKGFLVQLDADTLVLLYPFRDLAKPFRQLRFTNKQTSSPGVIPPSAKLSVRLSPNEEHQVMDAKVSLKPHKKAVRGQHFIPIHHFPNAYLGTNLAGADMYLVILGHHEYMDEEELAEFLGPEGQGEDEDEEEDEWAGPRRQPPPPKPVFLTDDQLDVVWDLLIAFVGTLGMRWANYSPPDGARDGLVYSRATSGDSYHISRVMDAVEITEEFPRCMAAFEQSPKFRTAMAEHGKVG